MHRFFVGPDTLDGDSCQLSPDIARQITRVLRLRPGERIELLDDTGWAWVTELDRVTPATVSGHIVTRHRPESEPRFSVSLYQALPKHQKFDWILQKGTELGVSTFVPLITERSEVRKSDRGWRPKFLRWERIVTEAAEQSVRARRPRVLAVATLEEVCTPLPEGSLGIMPCLGARRPLRELLREASQELPAEVRLLIGPEGGFTAREAEIGESAGYGLVSLGPRTLRTETAAIVSVAIVLQALGELG